MKGLRIFVAGTDTDVGKTFVSSILAKRWGCNYWKPIQTGLESEEGDLMTVKRLTKLKSDHFASPLVLLRKPLSPWVAAMHENKEIRVSDFTIPKRFQQSERCLLVEGAGGLYVPINRNEIMTDLITQLNCKTLLVCRSELGTINHTLLSIEHLRARGIEIMALIMNGIPNDDNAKAIHTLSGGVPILCQIPPSTSIDDLTLLVPDLESLVGANSQSP